MEDDDQWMETQMMAALPPLIDSNRYNSLFIFKWQCKGLMWEKFNLNQQRIQELFSGGALNSGGALQHIHQILRKLKK